MADEEDIVIKIEDDEKVTAAKPASMQKAGGSSDDPLTDLKGQFASLQQTSAAQISTAQTTATQATQRAERAEQEAAELRKNVHQTELDALETGIASADEAAGSIQREIERFSEEGDHKGIADASRRLAQAESRKLYLEQSRDDLKARAPAQQQQRPAAAPADPVEAFIQTRTPMTQNWLRQHRDYITDPVKNNKMTAAHYDAMAQGHQPDTDGYFKHVEKFVGIITAEADDNGNGDDVQRPGAAQQEKKPGATREIPGRRPPSSAASPAPARGGTEGNSGDVILSRGEAAAATDGSLVWNYDDPSGKGRFKKGDPIGLQEFARRKREMQRQGHYDKSYTDN